MISLVETSPRSRSHLTSRAANPGHPAASGLSLHVEDLACARGGRLIFSGLSFSLTAGQLLAITGPNGSGKSSLLRILAGLLRAEAGGFRIAGLGEDVAGIHYHGHADALKPALTLRETLRFWAALHASPFGAGDVADLAGQVGLLHALDLPARVLSAGQRRRAGLARLLLVPRPLWLLDEPTAALDRQGEDLLGLVMRSHLSGGGMIVAATHGHLPVGADLALDMAASA